MAKRVIWRGNTANFTFTFYDENGDVATCTSAELQLTYIGGSGDFETETLTLTSSGDNWVTTWDSTKAKAGWVEYHAHGYATATDYAQDGRFRLTANRASYDHDELPTNGTASNAAGQNTIADDYGMT